MTTLKERAIKMMPGEKRLFVVAVLVATPVFFICSERGLVPYVIRNSDPLPLATVSECRDVAKSEIVVPSPGHPSPVSDMVLRENRLNC
jgi:hypothetical protein